MTSRKAAKSRWCAWRCGREEEVIRVRYPAAMRVLVVHHGRLPTPGSPCTGGALRAQVHVDALRGAGHDVHTLARAQDEARGFRSPADLRRLAAAITPDWILC